MLVKGAPYIDHFVNIWIKIKCRFVSKGIEMAPWLDRRWQCNSATAAISFHDNVIEWKHFPRDWPFVRGIHKWNNDNWKQIPSYVPQKDHKDFTGTWIHYLIEQICNIHGQLILSCQILILLCPVPSLLSNLHLIWPQGKWLKTRFLLTF